MRGTSCRYRKDVRPKDQPILATDLAGLALQSPLIAAAGTAGTLDALADVLDLRELGAITTKSITREPREGNQPWRITGLRAGMRARSSRKTWSQTVVSARRSPPAGTPCTTAPRWGGSSFRILRAITSGDWPL